jgi:hypothetical protein
MRGGARGAGFWSMIGGGSLVRRMGRIGDWGCSLGTCITGRGGIRGR